MKKMFPIFLSNSISREIVMVEGKRTEFEKERFSIE
jgi:hypothetical protein